MENKRTVIYSRKNGTEEIRIVDDGSEKSKKGIRAFAPMLDGAPGQPSIERLMDTINTLSPPGRSKQPTTCIICVKAENSIPVEKEITMYDREGNLRAIAVWRSENGISFTKVH
jgi:hypothetical protein